MKLADWLDAKVGRTNAMAAHFKRSPAAVSQWRTNGVPASMMRAVRTYTRRAVGFEDMVPPAK